MSRASILIIIGLLTMLISFLGLPLAWVRITLPIFGLLVVIIGFLMRSDRIAALREQMPQPPSAPSNDAPSIS